MADLLLTPLAWFLFGPVADLLSSPLGVPAAACLAFAAVATGIGLGAAGDRLIGVRSVLAPLTTVPVGRLLRRQQPTNHPPKGGPHA